MTTMACVGIGTAIGLVLAGLYYLHIVRHFRKQSREWRERQGRE